MPSTRTRAGFALAVALFAIVIIGMLIAGAFFASTQEYRIGRNALQQSRSLAAAEFGLNSALSDWQTTRENALAVGASRTTSYDGGSGATASVRITKVSQLMYLVTSTGAVGTDASQASSRSVSALMRASVPEMNFLAALTTRGVTKIGGSSYIDGIDTAPTGWPCPPTSTNKPGLTTGDTSQVSFSGCSNQSCLNGSPKLAQNPLASDTNTYVGYGTATYATLTAMATKTYASNAGTINGLGPSVTGGVCSTGTLSNWGDPNRSSPAGACEGYFPIIWAQGTSTSSFKVTGGSGQGILLVDGDLEVSGGFTFWGPVIVRGHLKTTGTGGHFNGGVMAENVDLEQNTVLGNAVISYSSCALATALSGSSVPKPVKERSWAEMY